MGDRISHTPTFVFQASLTGGHMELVQLTEAAYQLRGGLNAGLIVQDGRAVLVDTGLDRDTAKKILRHIESLKITLAAVVITHAHADHCGGAATIRARTGAPVYAPLWKRTWWPTRSGSRSTSSPVRCRRLSCGTSSPWPSPARWAGYWSQGNRNSAACC